MLKIFFGALLVSCGFLLVPSIHMTVAKTFNLKRQTLVVVGLIAIVLLIFLILPMRGQYILGLLFMAIAGIMQWIVPRHEKTAKYISNVLFGGADIEDEKAPYSRVVSLFKLPLFGLGMWVILPWTVIFLDAAAIGGALAYWLKAKREAEAEEMKKEAKRQASVATGVAGA